ncbi:hypothetical protein L3X38_035960 [Prunus dulcis]|uniref:Mitochondrial protein n=1 Tax=Prunus dulcis TaxID=3755 RepID=A0AAD4YZ62_PRUDU|nr:hypothetical protein L3X38_035960 [Prunus dulcis]
MCLPNSFQEALEDSKWKFAMVKEMKALQANGTWDMVNIPDEKRTVGRKWVFTVKHKPNGSIESMVTQFMPNPGIQHMEVVDRIIQYLNSSLVKGILFSKNGNLDIEGYTDSDYAGSKFDRKSLFGYASFVGGNVVTLRSKKQIVVSLSSAEAEY